MVAKKIYYKIGEVAELFNVNTSLIRYWESEFKIIKPKKSSKGTRLFTQKDIDNFRIIYELVKVKGLTIQGANDFIRRKQEKNELEKVDVLNTLTRTKQLLVDLHKILETKEGSSDNN